MDAIKGTGQLHFWRFGNFVSAPADFASVVPPLEFAFWYFDRLRMQPRHLSRGFHVSVFLHPITLRLQTTLPEINSYYIFFLWRLCVSVPSG